MRIRVGSLPSILFFSLSAIILLSVVPPAYAGTLQPDNYGLPDALVNYNSDTNESIVTWDFSGLPDYTDGSLDGQEAKCIVKSDYDYNNNPETDPDLEITSFNPINYIPIDLPAITGLVLTSIIDSNVKGLEIPCTGQYTIDWDSVMNNVANTDGSGGSYIGVEPFISFYVMSSNEQFDTSDGIVIDEILIMYHPLAAEISQVTVDWACGANDFTDEDPKDGIDDNQIAVGNVLFIDITGIRGTGGPYNCDTVQELDSEEFCCVFYVATTSDSGGCDDCIDPTFYYSQNKILVKDGFRYNAFSTDVTDPHTETPLLITNTNQTNFIILKVYDNSGTSGIEWIDVGFGAAGFYESFDNAEVTIETKFFNNEIIDSYIDPPTQNLINFGGITSSIVACGGENLDAKCLQIIIPHSFRDQLLNPAIIIGATDESGNKKYHYINDGIEIQGKSLNEAPTDEIFIQKYLGDPSSEWIDIVRIDRVDNIWSSQDGMEFTQYGGGFQRITPLGFDNTLID